MLHQKSTRNSYRDLDCELQYISMESNKNISSYDRYSVLAEYDEMQRKSFEDDFDTL